MITATKILNPAKWSRGIAVPLAGTVVMKGINRYLLSPALTRFLNKKLRRLANPRIRFSDVRVNLLRGVFAARGGDIFYLSPDKTRVYGKIGQALVHLHWREILRGGLVADIDFKNPWVHVKLPLETEKPKKPEPAKEKTSTNGKADERQKPVTDTVAAWNKTLEKLFPFKIGHIGLQQGEFHLENLPGQNGVDVKMEKIDALAENITNSRRLSPTTVATLKVIAHVMSNGKFQAQAQTELLAEKPVFNVDATLRGLHLPELNPLLKENLKAVFNDGVLDVYSETAAAEGVVRGYIKPIIEHPEVEKLKEEGMGAHIKGVLAQITATLLKNKRRETIATRIEFSGPMDRPDVSAVSALKNTVRNAFVEAFPPGLEESVSVGKVALEADSGKSGLWKTRRSWWITGLKLMKETLVRWKADEAPRLGAALSYYTAFSLAPLLLLAIAIAGLAFGEEAVRGQIIGQLTGMVGRQSAETIQSMIQAASKPSSGIVATIISIFTLLLGSSAVMNELKVALNKIWKAKPKQGVVGLIKSRLLSFSMVLTIGFLLLVSLLVSSVLAAFGKYLTGVLPIPEAALHSLNVGVSFVVITSLFALLFKFVPDAEIEWRNVWAGAAMTTLFFVIGKFLLGLYFGKGAVGSSYGTAGSVLITLLWIYYSAQIFYLGAEFTNVYSEWKGVRRAEAAKA